MCSPIIYQNHASTVVLLDLPRSLEDGQAFNGTIQSSAEIEQPWPSTEPKGASLERVLASIDPDVLRSDQNLQSEIATALGEVRNSVRDRQFPWLYSRSAGASPVDVLPSYESRLDRKHRRATHVPPLVLSTSLEGNQLGSARQVQDVVIINPLAETNHLAVKGDTYLIPGSSRLLWSSMVAGLPAIEGATSAIMKSKFDLILMDPPWANRSVRRSKQYKTAETQAADPFMQAWAVVDSHLREDGILAIWVANKHADRVRVEATTQEHGLQLMEEWTWTKITSHGEPVTALDGVWRKPYETLLLFRKNVGTADRCRRFIFAVPDFHSRKPCLKRLFDHILPPGYQALELFARGLTAGWWSWGDEVLKFQHSNCWSEGTEARESPPKAEPKPAPKS